MCGASHYQLGYALSKRLFLSHTAAASGAELALLRLLRNSSRASNVVAFASDGPLVGEFERAGVEVHVQRSSAQAMAGRRNDPSVYRFVRSVGLLFSYGWHLGGWIRERDIGVVIAYSIKSLIYGAVAARRAGVPLVWSVHDRIASDSFGAVKAVMLRLFGLLIPDAVIVNSKATRSTVWAAGKPILELPPGIETAGPGGRRPAGGTLQQVAMVGRLCPWKGQMEFIEAFERVFTGTTVQGVIIGGALFGEEHYETAIKERVAGGTCPDQIRFTGAVDNVEELLRQSEIMVHASTIPEPFGAVVLEGLDAGCAVVATQPGGPAEIITDEKNGLLVPCGDVDALETALRRLQDDDLRAELANAGIGRASNFDVRLLADRAETWFSSVNSRIARSGMRCFRASRDGQ